MKYEYHDTIYNMDKFLSIYKGGKITVNSETTCAPSALQVVKVIFGSMKAM